MNGRRAKQIRRATGIPISARRSQREFERLITATREQRAEQVIARRRLRRQVFAWVGLAVLVACIVGALFL